MSNKPWLLKLAGLGMLLILCAAIPGEANYQFPLANPYRALSGTFGELRSDHFHSGIDLKTGGKSGAVIRAIEAGYVYRIKVNPYGYGNALYLRHPDGKFSVYGHLSRFAPRVEAFLRERQYASKSFAQDLYLGQDEIRFRKGDLIAWSGNSGSSLGPHLHFEIRDPQERILNPLRWYRDEIRDTRPPVLQAIGFEPIDVDSRVEGSFDKLTLQPRGSDGQYTLPRLVRVNGRVGLEYQAYDLLNAAGNHCGINYARLYLDGQLIHEFTLDRYAFDEKRYINVHLDYGHYRRSRQRLQRAYTEPGNRFPANRPILDQGMIVLEDNLVHKLRLELSDFHGNTTTLTGNIQRDPAPQTFPPAPTWYSRPELSYRIHRNVLKLTANRAHRTYRDGLVVESIYGDKSRLMPAYMKGSELVFLLPLDRYTYPKLIRDEIGLWSLELNLTEELSPYQNNLVAQGEMRAFFPYKSVFERVHLEVVQRRGTRETYSDIFRVGDESIPLLEPFLVSFDVPDDRQVQGLVVARHDGDGWEYLGSTRGENGEVYGSSLSFGEFALLADSVAPAITPINFTHQATFSASQDRVVVKVEDEFSGIDYDRIFCTLDGEWQLFEYDFRPGTLTWQWQERPAAGWHDLEISIRDQAGNLATRKYRVRF